MRSKHALTMALFILTLTLTRGLAGASPAVPATPGAGHGLSAASLYIPGQLVIKLAPRAAALVVHFGEGQVGLEALPEMARLNQLYGVTRVEAIFPASTGRAGDGYRLADIFLLHAGAASDIWAMAAAYATSPDVLYAEPNLRAWLADAPNDPLLPNQWSLENTGQSGGHTDDDIDALAAWALESGDPSVLVAILDTGVAYNHPDLAANVRTDIDYDFFSGDDDAFDSDGHGTSVAGIAAAVSNNNLGMAGVCQNCQIVPVRVGNWVVHFGSVSVAQGIEYAAAPAPAGADADVISMSLGGFCSELWADAVNYAYDQNVVMVAAAGNFTLAYVVHPAKFNRVIAVSATDDEDDLAWFSSWGPEVDVAAPGADIRTTIRGGDYGLFSGTSAATPHVSGTAGLLLSRNPGLTQAEVHQILRNTADQQIWWWDPNWLFGYGRLNAGDAVEQALDPPTNVYDPGPDVCGSFLKEIMPPGPDGAELLATYESIGERLLAGTDFGDHLVARFAPHDRQIASLLLLDAAVRDQALALLRAGQPLINSLLDGDGEHLLSVAFIGQAEDFFQKLSARASPALQQAIEDSWAQLDLPAHEGQPVGGMRLLFERTSAE